MNKKIAPNEPWDARRLVISQHNGIPKYLQLRNALGGAIREGRWKSGAKLPPEDQLAQSTRLSLGTVQRALGTLVHDGLVVRRQGMGTFVVDNERPLAAPFYHCRFLDDDGRLLPIFSKALRRRQANDGGEWSRYFPGANVLCIERLFSVNHEFAIYTHLYIDGNRFPTLGEIPLGKLNGVNFKELIPREYHLALARFSENLAVMVFPDHVCKAINVKRRTSGAVLEIVARDATGEPVYFQDLFIPPNLRRLFVS